MQPQAAAIGDRESGTGTCHRDRALQLAHYQGQDGAFNFADTGVSLNGYSYAPLTNTETSDSIAR